MLLIRDVYTESELFHPGSEFFLSRIRIKEFKYFGSEFFLSRIRIKEFKYLTPKMVSNLSKI